MTRILAAILLCLCVAVNAQAATTILPPGQTCFVVGGGAPASSGSLNMYIPGTTTPKATYQDPNQAAQNTQPIQLDANGCATIYGVGSYRQQLYDGPVVGGVTTGNLIFDKLTTDTSASNAVFWANTALAAGTPNAIQVSDAGFPATDGTVVQFIPISTNTGATTITLTGSGSPGPYSIVKDGSAGAVALVGGEIVAGSPSNVVSVVYSATQNNFHILNLLSATATSPVPPPQGYLTLLNAAGGGPIQQSADITAATTVYYSPLTGNQIPIWNGSSFTLLTFPELSLTLSAASQLASTIYDACVFNNAGAPVAVFGPAWSNSAAGTGSRGTGGGSAQISRQNGIWVNTVQISANNGATTYTIPALQCTYVGSVSIDSVAGQVSAYRTWGQNRKFGVWSAYNRQLIVLQAGDSTASWTYSSLTIRQSNAASGNTLTVFAGLPEEIFFSTFTQKVAGQITGGSVGAQILIGWNSTTAGSGTVGEMDLTNNNAASVLIRNSPQAVYAAAPTIGINNVNALEAATTAGNSATFFGTQGPMLLQTMWRG